MKTAVHEIDPLALELVRDEPAQTLAGDLMVLTKARLSLLVVVTTFVGACLASGSHLDWVRIAYAVFGTTLAAAAAAVLNQVVEADVDRLMERTRYRPLPAGRMRHSTAFMLGIGLAITGVAWLYILVNGLSASLAAATIAIYVLVYTPMKRRTCFCTVMGAVAGAIPPVIGWAAIQPSLGLGAWVLFGVLFTWQMPHFLAIAWMYRDEYAQAGFVMLKRDDPTGAITGWQSFGWTVALVAVAAVPWFAGSHGTVYLAGAMLLTGAMLVCAGQFLVERSRPTARQLFLASIIFLPLLLGLMVFSRL